MPDIPRRRVELHIKISADSWHDAINAINAIGLDLHETERLRHSSHCCISGGYNYGYIAVGDEDPKVDHDSYIRELYKYLDEQRKAKEGK